jgi:hypothetical protein
MHGPISTPSNKNRIERFFDALREREMRRVLRYYYS